MTVRPIDLEPEQPPHPDEYLPEPVYTESQDDGAFDAAALVSRLLTLAHPMAPRTWEEALNACAAESVHRTKDWFGRCQEFCRTMPGCPGGAASALAAFTNAPEGARHVGGNPEDAPTGAVLISKSRNPDSSAFTFGHAIYCARPFATKLQGAWSTDALRVGWPDKINPRELYLRWDHQYLGWIEWQNGLWLDLRKPPPPQTRRYAALDTAVVNGHQLEANLATARDKAKALEEWKDRDAIRELLREQRALTARISEAADKLRRP